MGCCRVAGMNAARRLICNEGNEKRQRVKRFLKQGSYGYGDDMKDVRDV
jgi:hypothetical protein